MNIDKGEVAYGVRSRKTRIGDYQCDGTDAAYYTSSDSSASGGVPGTVLDSGVAPDAITGQPVEVIQDSTPLVPENAAATLPSIIKPPESGMTVVDQFNCWVDRNPILAIGVLVGTFLLFKGGKKK